MVYETAIAKTRSHGDVEYVTPHYETVTELIRAYADDEILRHVNFSIKLGRRDGAIAWASRAAANAKQ